MKIGLFYEHQSPRPWDEETDYRILHEAVEQIEFADRMGFDYVWLVEHHFLEEYSHCSAPEVFLSYVAARTKQIRLGHGIVVMPWRYNHPIRVAERVSTLDLLSNGRVEFGAGESSSEAELGGFGIDPREKRALWEESLRVAVSAMTSDPFPGHVGPALQIPPRNVLPKPRQKPHPPLWLAATKADGFKTAARLGMGVLSFAFISPEQAHVWIEAYYKEIEESCVPLGEAINPQVACTAFVMCAPTREEAQKRAAAGPAFFEYAMSHYYARGTHRPGQTDIWRQFEQDKPQSLVYPGVGTPDQIRERMLANEAAGMDQIICIMQAGRNKHEHIMESLELMGTKVLPDIKARDEAHQKRKAERLAPVLEKAMARKPRPAPPPADYSFSSPCKTMDQRAEVDDFYRSLNGTTRQSVT